MSGEEVPQGEEQGLRVFGQHVLGVQPSGDENELAGLSREGEELPRVVGRDEPVVGAVHHQQGSGARRCTTRSGRSRGSMGRGETRVRRRSRRRASLRLRARPRVRKLWSRMKSRAGVPTMATASKGRERAAATTAWKPPNENPRTPTLG